MWCSSLAGVHLVIEPVGLGLYGLVHSRTVMHKLSPVHCNDERRNRISTTRLRLFCRVVLRSSVYLIALRPVRSLADHRKGMAAAGNGCAKVSFLPGNRKNLFKIDWEKLGEGVFRFRHSENS